LDFVSLFFSSRRRHTRFSRDWSSDVCSSDLMETLIIGQIGGLLGILLGILIGFAVSSAAGFDFITPWKAMFWATGITILVAILAGSYPASKAAAQDPVASLHYE